MSKFNSTLTAERLREVVSYEPDTGIFTNNFRRGCLGAGAPTGWLERGYLRIAIDKIDYKAHRLAWLYMTGEWPAEHVDHIDANKTNNCWSNLRQADRSLNMQNRRKPHYTNKCGLLGVTQRGNRFIATIMIDKRNKWLGSFVTPEEAYAVYLEAKRKLHPGNTL